MIDDGSRQRMAELHVSTAREHALELCAYSSCVFPEEWTSPLNEKIVIRLADFANHAYRAQELCGLASCDGASVTRFKFELPNGKFEDDYQKALNLIRHARVSILGWVIDDRNAVYLSSKQQVVPSYVKVETDKYSGAVSIFGVCFVFLTQIISAVKLKHTNMKF